MAHLGAGYNQLFTPNADTVIVDGYIQFDTDGYTAITSPLPKEIDSVTHDASKNYKFYLKQCWTDVLYWDVSPVASSPVLVQKVFDNVGASGTVSGEQYLHVKFIDPTDGSTAVNLASGGAVHLLIILKRSSA